MYVVGTATSAVPTTFIEGSCKVTRFPAVCVQSLSAQATAIGRDPQKLAQTSLFVSLARAKSTKLFMLQLAKLRGLRANEHAALKDCLDNMDDGVDRLRQSVREFEELVKAQGEDILWHKSNIATWVSSAMDSEETCKDGLNQPALDGKMKNSITTRIEDATKVTSNALAFLNTL
ncbi:hypothetical protein RJ640_022860 [Escallonia rubra]|uniref:Pectinesterase inhibitor domain-containing protein n=1 Tax=Escallonia rubra TaxID=112253 RepID=A0AA88QT66_9ASTE|nr:hypothetical protein RJ640_022860 [Escallonia rubra]